MSSADSIVNWSIWEQEELHRQQEEKMKENEIRTVRCKNCDAVSREFVFDPFGEIPNPVLKEDGWADLMIHIPEDMAKPPKDYSAYFFYLCNSCSKKYLGDLASIAIKISPDLYKIDGKEKSAWVL